MVKLGTQHDGSPAIPAPPQSLPHHPLWYADDLTTFQVEGTLFRIRSRKLTERSAKFREMVDRQDEGRSDEYPILLDDSQADFCSLLKLFNRRKAGPLDTVDEWVSILRLSQKYEFSQEVSERAAEEITKCKDISASKLYELGQTFQIPKLTEMAIIRFCNAMFTMRAIEARQIGFSMAFAIGAVREHLLVSNIPFDRNLSSSDRDDLLRMVRNIESGRDILDGCSPTPQTISSRPVRPVKRRGIFSDDSDLAVYFNPPKRRRPVVSSLRSSPEWSPSS
ncbi:hypothetical protein DL96DRAFT_1620985 [Flagelloscypha sp. PMI_526]|nr:hypothetical protein DL96DRAFT_1620985 [Flagelloscypha sp. PMI_526]